jgi:HupE / UreJ protein
MTFHPSFLRRFGFFLVIFLLISAKMAAHTINYDLASMPKDDVGLMYFKLGFEHILPLGIDHILFVLCLFFFSPKLSTVIWQATAFTVAHSITLGLAMYGYIKPLPAIIEPIIALSIFFVAVENLLVETLRPGRIAIVFGFGLVHGMGFASALTSVGMPTSNYMISLLTFNLGVEMGQLSVILLAWLLLGRWFSDKSWYRKWVITPISVAIALIALYWTFERTLN